MCGDRSKYAEFLALRGADAIFNIIYLLWPEWASLFHLSTGFLCQKGKCIRVFSGAMFVGGTHASGVDL